MNTKPIATPQPRPVSPDPEPWNRPIEAAWERPIVASRPPLSLSAWELRAPPARPVPPKPETRSIGTQTDPEPGFLQRWFGW